MDDMKKQNIIAIIMMLLLLVAPVAMPAATFWDGMKAPVGQILGVVLTLFGVPLIIKLGRKMGLTIDEQLAADAIDTLINILVNIDLKKGGGGGADKKAIAVKTAEAMLTNAQRDILIKKYGSLEAAVQVAFERSSLRKTR